MGVGSDVKELKGKVMAKQMARDKRPTSEQDLQTCASVTTQDLQVAKYEIIKSVQKEAVSEEIDSLHSLRSETYWNDQAALHAAKKKKQT